MRHRNHLVLILIRYTNQLALLFGTAYPPKNRVPGVSHTLTVRFLSLLKITNSSGKQISLLTNEASVSGGMSPECRFFKSDGRSFYQLSINESKGRRIELQFKHSLESPEFMRQEDPIIPAGRDSQSRLAVTVRITVFAATCEPQINFRR